MGCHRWPGAPVVGRQLWHPIPIPLRWVGKCAGEVLSALLAPCLGGSTTPALSFAKRRGIGMGCHRCNVGRRTVNVVWQASTPFRSLGIVSAYAQVLLARPCMYIASGKVEAHH